MLEALWGTLVVGGEGIEIYAVDVVLLLIVVGCLLVL